MMGTVSFVLCCVKKGLLEPIKGEYDQPLLGPSSFTFLQKKFNLNLTSLNLFFFFSSEKQKKQTKKERGETPNGKRGKNTKKVCSVFGEKSNKKKKNIVLGTKKVEPLRVV